MTTKNFLTMYYRGHSASVIAAVQQAREMMVSSHYFKASATNPEFEWLAKAKVPTRLAKQFSLAGWYMEPQPLKEKPQSQKKAKAKKKQAGLNVRGAEHWQRIEKLRLSKASSKTNAMSAMPYSKISLVLYSKRGTILDFTAICGYCGRSSQPVWMYKESSDGQILLCGECKERIYKHSHPNSSYDAMNRAVYRKRGRW